MFKLLLKEFPHGDNKVVWYCTVLYMRHPGDCVSSQGMSGNEVREYFHSISHQHSMYMYAGEQDVGCMMKMEGGKRCKKKYKTKPEAK